MFCLWHIGKQFEIERSDTLSQLLVELFLRLNIGALYFVTEVLNTDSHAGEASEV
jgi:hypothetical protein